MRGLLLALFVLSPAAADVCRVTIDGTGCRTRQLAIQRAFTAIDGVEKVEVMPRGTDGPPNRRVFVIHRKGPAPERGHLEAALGKKAGRYRIVSVENEPQKPVSADSGSS